MKAIPTWSWVSLRRFHPSGLHWPVRSRRAVWWKTGRIVLGHEEIFFISSLNELSPLVSRKAKMETNESDYMMPYNSRVDVVCLLGKRYYTKPNVKLVGFRSQLQASYLCSLIEELWYNETVWLWTTLCIYTFNQRFLNYYFEDNVLDKIYIYIYIYISYDNLSDEQSLYKYICPEGWDTWLPRMSWTFTNDMELNTLCYKGQNRLHVGWSCQCIRFSSSPLNLNGPRTFLLP